MKKILLAMAMLAALGGCKTTPDLELGEAKAVQVPPLPEALSKRAERLPDITDPSMGGIQVDGVEADKRYNEVAHQNNALITIYNCVRDAVNARDASKAAQCMKDGVE
jgi:hypothetical protein